MNVFSIQFTFRKHMSVFLENLDTIYIYYIQRIHGLQFFFYVMIFCLLILVQELINKIKIILILSHSFSCLYTFMDRLRIIYTHVRCNLEGEF